MPRELGQYILEEELGRGGFAIVYRARDRQLDREVALKVFTASPLGAELLPRLAREAAALARIRDPGLVAVHEVQLEGPHPYLAMDLIEGESLERRLQRTGPLPPAPAVRIALALARTLSRLHAQQVVHRDLKASNVILRPDDRPVLLDLGLALLLDHQLRLTRTGELLGTPHCMAPEQVQGARDEVGPASDVWALGVLLCRLLAGRPPFPGGSALATLEQVVRGRPLLPGGDRQLDELCARCLIKDPAARITLPEVIARLEAWQQVGAPGRRRRPIALLCGAILVGGGGLLAALSSSPSTTTRAPATAPGPAPAARGGDAPDVAAIASRARLLARRGANEDALALFGEAIGREPSSVQLRCLRAKLLDDLERVPEAQADVKVALTLDPRSAAALALRGYLLLRAGSRSDQIPSDVEEALRIDPGCADARYVRGMMRLRLGRAGAVEDLELAWAGQPDEPGLGAALALALLLQRDLARAERLLEQIGRTEPDLIQLIAARALLLASQGDHQAARRTLDRALQRDPHKAAMFLQPGVRAPWLASTASAFVAEALASLGRVAEAQAFVDASLKALGEGLLDELAPQRVATQLRARARVEQALGHLDQAEQHLDDALRAAPADDLVLALARVQLARGRAREASQTLTSHGEVAEEVKTEWLVLAITAYLDNREPGRAHAWMAELEQRAPDDPRLLGLRRRLPR